jgi:hypothetical protein
MVCQNQSKLPTLTHDTYTEHIPVHLEMDNIGNYILSLIHITYIYIYTYHSSVYMHEWIEWMEHIRGNHDFQHDGSDGIGHFKS